MACSRSNKPLHPRIEHEDCSQVPYKNNTQIDLGWGRKKTHACLPSSCWQTAGEKIFLLRRFDSILTHSPTDEIRNGSCPYQDWSLKGKPLSRRVLLIWTSRGLQDLALSVCQAPSCISEASFRHFKSHPDLRRHVLKTPETGSDREMIFNQIFLCHVWHKSLQDVSFQCISPLTQNMSVLSYVSANIALGCTEWVFEWSV